MLVGAAHRGADDRYGKTRGRVLAYGGQVGVLRERAEHDGVPTFDVHLNTVCVVHDMACQDVNYHSVGVCDRAVFLEDRGVSCSSRPGWMLLRSSGAQVYVVLGSRRVRSCMSGAGRLLAITVRTPHPVLR